MGLNEKIKTYYRLTKPGIIYGNLLTTLAGFFLASRGDVDFWLLVAAASGTGLVMASGCVFNNYIDRGIDAKMRRTQKRATVTGDISGRNALIFGAVLGALGFAVLALFTNTLVVMSGLIAIFFYVVLYGIAKRASSLGTVVGSVPGALPPVAGYLAVSNSLDTGALVIFLIMAIWQMPHFYAISIFRLKDYAAAGLPVLSVKRGVKTTKLYIMLYIAAYIAVIPLLTILGYTGYAYLAVMGGIGVFWFWKGVSGFAATDSTAWARKMFGVSLIVLLTFSFILSVDVWLP